MAIALTIALVGCTSASQSSGACAEINESDFDASCQVDADCMAIQTGKVCEDGTGCICGAAAINVRDADRYNTQYQAAISVIHNASARDPNAFHGCGCGRFGTPHCIANRCEMCGGIAPNPACPDGG
jgi:hypothetical protein